jgi:hypothetical protein
MIELRPLTPIFPTLAGYARRPVGSPFERHHCALKNLGRPASIKSSIDQKMGQPVEYTDPALHH